MRGPASPAERLRERAKLAEASRLIPFAAGADPEPSLISMNPVPESSGGLVSQALAKLVSQIPDSDQTASAAPAERAALVARKAALRAAGVSGALALPPGPLGFATLLPDLLAVWRIQQAMVADIAAIYGKSAALKSETMVYCLFKHGGAALVRDLVTRVGQRYLVRSASLRLMQRVLERMGVHVTQRVLGRGLSRFFPVLGACAVGGYAYYDTTKVAATAIELFSQDLEMEPEWAAERVEAEAN